MAPKPGEHPLMSNRTLRSIYAGLASAQALLSVPVRKTAVVKAAQADTACLVVPLQDLVSMDMVFGCRAVSLLEHLRPASHPPIAHPMQRLYAAIGAAMTARGKPPQPVVVAFFERHEIEGRHWPEALQRAAGLPLLLIVLPRWKGRDTAAELGKLARAAGVPCIPVDARDPIALYRVAQESLTRARAAGGAALLETIHLPGSEPATTKLAAYLLHRNIATKAWLDARSEP